jgi:pilus assembly protein CpaB
MRSPRSSLLLALAIGAVATVGVRGLIVSGRAATDGAGPGSTIVVAREPVPFGTPLTAENMREVPWRSTDRPDGSFATVSELLRSGRRLSLAALQRNEPILAFRVTVPNGRATLSTQIEDGMRAVTVRVDEVRGVAGFVVPGDRVDVILTRGEGGDVSAFADVLLQNARVLAVDQLVDERQDKPSVARAVTLGLSVNDAQKIVLAQSVGRLSLALRQANGGDTTDVARVTVSDLGAVGGPARDRVEELEKELATMRGSLEVERQRTERTAAERLAASEARLRAELGHTVPVASVAVPSTIARPPGARVTVIRNGSKSETYSVTAER